MKDLIVVIVVIALVFGGDFFIGKYYENVGKEIINQVSVLESKMTTDNEIEKKERVEEIRKNWEENENMLIFFQYHSSINDLEDLIIECCEYYKENEKTEFAVSFEKLKRNLDDIKNRGRLLLNNVI